ncbi:MAG: CHASE domain-containing protein [Planctomycetota bacterium]|nr:CHASE domain-containing protein [Planctomycetota bacterium]
MPVLHSLTTRQAIAKLSPSGSPHWKHYVPIPVVFLVGLTLTVFLNHELYGIEREAIGQRFREAGEDRVVAIRKVIDNKILMLEAVRSFFHSSARVERHEFRDFAQPFLTHEGGVGSLQWLPRVRADERTAYEAAVREEGFPEFGIREVVEGAILGPAGAREEYFPVHFVERFEENRAVFGFDPLSSAVEREALERARDVAQLAASARIQPIQDPEGGAGVILALPVYAAVDPPASVENRRRSLRGFILGIFSLKVIVSSSLDYVPDAGMNLEIADLTASAADRLLFSVAAKGAGSEHGLKFSLDSALLEDLRYVEEISLGGRRWQVTGTPTIEFIQDSLTWYPLLLLPIGLAITSLVTGYFVVNIGRQQKIERLVVKRTTELRHSNQQLRDAQDHLIQAAKLESVGRLAAGVAHEVKNPLGVIQFGIDYLRQATRDSGDLSEVVQEMEDAVSRADVVIRGLVDFSRAETLRKESRDLNEVIQQSAKLVKHELTQHNIILQMHLADQVPTIPMDANKIKQVFINLFMNATQAMERNGSVIVTTGLTDGQGSEATIVVKVEDTGPGIPEDHLQHIFDPFFTTKPPGKGTGLGLSVTQNILKLHHATIDVANRPEGGASFTLRFRFEGEKE